MGKSIDPQEMLKYLSEATTFVFNSQLLWSYGVCFLSVLSYTKKNYLLLSCYHFFYNYRHCSQSHHHFIPVPVHQISYGHIYSLLIYYNNVYFGIKMYRHQCCLWMFSWFWHMHEVNRTLFLKTTLLFILFFELFHPTFTLSLPTLYTSL